LLKEIVMSRIVPCLWFEKGAGEAAKFYVSIFKDGKLGHATYYGKEGFEIHGQKEGTLLTVEFSIMGQDFTALNGGPLFKFTEAVSFRSCARTSGDRLFLGEARSGGQSGGAAMRLAQGQIRASPGRSSPKSSTG
jgi:predicted 3-demethylubiquinone-9 3-methyltransferase (glyoxalase superfamily)